MQSLTAGDPTTVPPVVMVPGMGAPGYLAPWLHQTATWTQVTVLDLPGWQAGRSRSCPPSVAGVAAAAAQWLQTTDTSDVILVGHSTGAQAVLHTARLVPDRIRAVVIASPTFVPAARGVLTLLRRVLATIGHEAAGELAAVAPSYLASGVAYLRLLLSGLRDRPEQTILGVAQPILVVTGDQDRLAPPAWARHLAALGHADCVVTPGAHNACYTDPRSVDAALRQFATSLSCHPDR